MEDIQIIKKPDWVSWDEIHEIVYKAHASNRERGIDIRNAHLSGEELRESLGEDGICFVALDGNKVVATSSVAFHTLNTWYARKEKVGYGTLSAVLPEYKGQHLFSKLERTRIDYAKEKGYHAIYKKIAEGNTKMRSIAKKDGYYEVAIMRSSFNPHNYVVIYKWLGERPFSEFYIKLRFLLCKFKLELKLWLRIIK